MKIYIQLDKREESHFVITEDMQFFSNILSTLYSPDYNLIDELGNYMGVDFPLSWGDNDDNCVAWPAYYTNHQPEAFVITKRQEVVDTLSSIGVDVITIVSVANTLSGFKRAIYRHNNKGVNVK